MVLPIVDTKKKATFAAQVGYAPLHELLALLGYDIAALTPEGRTIIAERLSKIAGQDPPWGHRYIHNLLTGKQTPSARFAEATTGLLSILDGSDPRMVRTTPVQVYTIDKKVKPGALVLAASRSCANPRCPVEFVPVVPRQKYCCADCRKRAK